VALLDVMLPQRSAHRPSALPDPATLRRVSVIELAEAAAFADVAAAICVLSRFLPIAGFAMGVASIPFAVLAARRRLRVDLMAAATGYVVAFLFGGYGTANMVAGAAMVGVMSGIAMRRRWSMGTLTVVAAGTVGIGSAAVSAATLAIFGSYREFMFDQARNGWGGVARGLRNANASGVARVGDDILDWTLRWWWVTIPAASLLGVVLLCRLVFRLHRRFVPGLVNLLGTPATDRVTRSAASPDPIPLTARSVAVVHPGAEQAAIADVDLDLSGAELVAVVGPNGAGKSTLARVLAGREPTGGIVTRPGPAGLGEVGGTAVIGQRPEMQVLGMRVADDLSWGAIDLTDGQIDALLRRVGLTGLADAETGSLSGGQLQRLAVAAALARDPRLLISDESTAMIDRAGRADIVALYREAVTDGAEVVHITHDPAEIADADRVIDLHPVAGVTDRGHSNSSVAPDSPLRMLGAPIVVDRVDYAHDAGTPWHHDALHDVSLAIEPGEMVLITGENGAGKSTLARLIAGLDRPVSGRVVIDGRSAENGRRAALFGLQHARLGLLRHRVRDDIRHAADVPPHRADAVLAELGLDPDIFGDKRIDELSVGQQRRVMLAGLLACKPRVLVLDEPLAGLDAASRVAMMRALRRVKASGLTTVIVSHDLDELATLADRSITLADGRIVDQPPVQLPPGLPEAIASQSKSRATLATVMGRMLPGESPAHRLWVGTKLGTLIVLALMFALSPTWASAGAALVIVVGWSLLGRIPGSALPRLPWWLVVATLAGGALTAFGGGAPYVSVGGVRFGLGGASTWGILISITVLSLYASMLLCWTTPMVEIPAFLQRIVRVAELVRVPLRPLATSIALALRLCPFFISDCRTLLQTVRQRRPDRPQTGRERFREVAGILPIACMLASSNAREFADAIDARGGFGAVARVDRGPRVRDAVVFAVVLALVAGAIALPTLV